MPSYLYKCENPNCVGEFEEFHSIRDDAKLKFCPICEKEGRGAENPVERLVCGGSGRGIVELTTAEFKASLPAEQQKILNRGGRDLDFADNLLGGNKINSMMKKLGR